MGSLLRAIAIAAAVWSWFRIARGRRNRLAVPADRGVVPASDDHQESGSTVAPAPVSLRVGACGSPCLERLHEPVTLRQAEHECHPAEHEAPTESGNHQTAEEAARATEAE